MHIRRGRITRFTRRESLMSARTGSLPINASASADEGGDCLEGKVGRLDDLYQRGVRSLQLVHYAQNTFGDLQTKPPVYNGLSTFGRDVVRRMNRLGMLVDVAHAAFATVKATVD